MVGHSNETEAPDPQPGSPNPAVERRDNEDVGDGVERESVKAAVKSVTPDTELNRRRSAATSVSATTQATAAPGQNTAPRKWFRRLNPLRWGPLPPVPAERAPCPESTAGFFSLLTFSWMGPLMTVSQPQFQVFACCCR